jgi:hypothetical protein
LRNIKKTKSERREQRKTKRKFPIHGRMLLRGQEVNRKREKT